MLVNIPPKLNNSGRKVEQHSLKVEQLFPIVEQLLGKMSQVPGQHWRILGHHESLFRGVVRHSMRVGQDFSRPCVLRRSHLR